MRHLIPAFLILASGAFAQGVFVFKNQNFHPDSSAQAFRYSKVEKAPPVVWVIADGRRMRVESKQFHTWLPLPPSIPNSISSEAEIKRFKGEYLEAERFYNRFNAARPLMEEWLTKKKVVLDKLEAGEIRYQGEWMSNAQFQQSLVREEQERERRRMEKEARRMEKEALRKDERQRMELQSRLAIQQREARREQRMGEVESLILERRNQIAEIKRQNFVSIEKLNKLLTVIK